MQTQNKHMQKKRNIFKQKMSIFKQTRQPSDTDGNHSTFQYDQKRDQLNKSIHITKERRTEGNQRTCKRLHTNPLSNTKKMTKYQSPKLTFICAHPKNSLLYTKLKKPSFQGKYNQSKYTSITSLQKEERLEKTAKLFFEMNKREKLRRQSRSRSKLQKQESSNEIRAIIRKIHSIIKQLQSLGFSEKSISHWMSRYLSKKNIHFIEIFMKIHVNEKSLSNSVIYQKHTRIQTSFQKLEAALLKFPLNKNQFIFNEVKQLRQYIEDILIKKTQARIMEIKNCFQTCTINTRMLPQKTVNNEILHFMNDLKTLQSRNGELQLLSNINKIKFQAINKAEQIFSQVYSRKKFEQAFLRNEI